MPRTRTRSAAAVRSRRFPRFQLDVDWFVESQGSSSMGRGLQISARGALLPVTCTSPFTDGVTLYLSLPLRPKMFKARCTAEQEEGRGWVLHFDEVSPLDLQLLGHTLLSEFGTESLPVLMHRSTQSLEF